jgi:hypothetical protein
MMAALMAVSMVGYLVVMVGKMVALLDCW